MTALGRHRKLLMQIAVGVSLGVHLLIGWRVMGLTIQMDPDTSLFAQQVEREIEPVRVTRAMRDLIIDDAADDPTKPDDFTPDPSRVRDDSQKLIEQVDPTKLLPPEPKPIDPAQLAGPRTIDPTPPPPKSDDPRSDPAKPLNLTPKLLAMARPSVALPEYKGPTDAVTFADPSNTGVDSTARIDLGKIDLRNIGGSPDGTPGSGGTGTGGTGTGGTGTGRAGTPIVPPPPPPPTPEPTGPPMVKLPPIAVPVPPVPAPGPNGEPLKPTIHLDEDFDYALYTFNAPPPKGGLFEALGLADQPKAEETGYFEVRVTPRRSLKRLDALGKDVVYVIDTSGSIKNNWMTEAMRGVTMALGSLNPGDRFNIVTFKDTVRIFSPEAAQPVTDPNLAAAKAFMAQAGEASGYTDVNRALEKFIVRNTASDRVYQIVLISDGKPTRGAIDARTIINLITRENDLVAGIYCVGIGDQQDRTLLEFLAYRNKGFAVYPNNVGQCAETIRGLSSRLRYPVLKDVVFDALGVNSTHMHPRTPRDVYQGEPFSIFGRFEPGTRHVSVRLAGANGRQPVDFTVTLPMDKAHRGDQNTMQLWAFWKLHHLYAEIIRQGKTPELQKQIDALRKQYDLKTAY